jgi:hypothetical protein
MRDDETGIGNDLIFLIVVAHEADEVPVVAGELNRLLLSLDHFIVPVVSRVDQLAAALRSGTPATCGSRREMDSAPVRETFRRGARRRPDPKRSAV